MQTGEHKLWFYLLYSSIKKCKLFFKGEKRKLMNSISRRNLLLLLPRDLRTTVIYLMVGF